MKKTIQAEVFNYIDKEIFLTDPNGMQFQHLGSIVIKNKIFIVYRAGGHNYIEEKVTNLLSEKILGEDKLKYISNDKVYNFLTQVAHKNNLLPTEEGYVS